MSRAETPAANSRSPASQRSPRTCLDPLPERARRHLVGPEEDEGGVLQEQRQAEGEDDRVLLGTVHAHGVDRPQQSALHRDAEHRDARHGDRQSEHGRQCDGDREQLHRTGGQRVERVAAEHVELAVGEVHHPHDAEHHGQSERDERIDQAEDQAVDDLGEDVVVHGTVSRGCACPLRHRQVGLPAGARPPANDRGRVAPRPRPPGRFTAASAPRSRTAADRAPRRRPRTARPPSTGR